MTPGARLRTLSDILIQIVENPKIPADNLLNSYFRGHRFIGSKDRRFLSQHTYNLLRRRGILISLAEALKASRKMRPAIEWEVIIYARVFLKSSVSDIERLADGQSYHLDPLTPAEKLALESIPRDLGHLPNHATLSFPQPLTDLLERSFGPQNSDIFKSALAGLLEEAPLDIRINPLKTTRAEILDYFMKESVEVAPCALSDLGIRFRERRALSNDPLFLKGFYEIQDQGSQLLGLLLGVKPGMRVLDLCAGAGGKTLVLGALMQNKGQIIATDINAVRLEKSKERFRRAGLHNIETRCIEDDKWLKRQKENFDRVLVDAPCSGSGTWRRNPDQKWKLQTSDVQNLSQIQEDLLKTAARITKPQGKIVYATCSFFAEENEDIIENFLKSDAGNEFEMSTIGALFPWLGAHCEGPYLKLSPHKSQTDGFFAALLTKSKG